MTSYSPLTWSHGDRIYPLDLSRSHKVFVRAVTQSLGLGGLDEAIEAFQDPVG